MTARSAEADVPSSPARTGESKGLLRFLTCGSVDDGKSTLIGRLLYESQLIYEDHLASITRDSRRFGTTGDEIDLALLLDGLEAEREQGITIDVAYRFFSTERRKFIVADTPGHEQYTRNMVTGASTSDLAVLLVDARHGIVVQTRRHAFIASLLGIRHIVLAINKIDLVDFSSECFAAIHDDFIAFAKDLGFTDVVAIPLSARYGDNVTVPSPRTPWYRGPSLIEHLETVEVADEVTTAPFRMWVQWVNRPNLDFRGFSGTIATGRIRPGDRIAVARSGRVGTVAAIVTADGEPAEARAGEAITLRLAEEIDISRGDLLASPEARPPVSDRFTARLVWMAPEPLLPGRSYLLKCGTKTVGANVGAIRHEIDVVGGSFAPLAAGELRLNAIGVVDLQLAEPIAFDLYDENRATGGFILIDRLSNATVGAGMINGGWKQTDNVHWEMLSVTPQARAAQKMQTPAVVWFTGLSASGKSTIADLVEKKLHAQGRHTFLLDGDNLRHGLNDDLGFSAADRVENIRRAGEVAKLMMQAGLIVLVSFISPFRAERRMVRQRIGEGFVEVFVDTPLEVCEARDPKGLYGAARAGRLRDFTGIDSPYERPEAAEITIDTTVESVQEAADRIVERLGLPRI
jgi:bifunctional enzyme CysN/CysC